MKIVYHPVGIIHTPFLSKGGMPIQPGGATGIKGTIEINPEYSEGLTDLEGFSHIILIYHFHKSQKFNLHVIPFLDNVAHGVFATRAPERPNHIGISVVKLLTIRDTVLEIENVDILDGTPLLDIKPYIPVFDVHQTETCGWMDQKIRHPGNIKSDNRFS